MDRFCRFLFFSLSLSLLKKKKKSAALKLFVLLSLMNIEKQNNLNQLTRSPF